MAKEVTFEEASLEYHRAQGEFDTNGKTATLLTKPCNTEDELSMAYPEKARQLTLKTH